MTFVPSRWAVISALFAGVVLSLLASRALGATDVHTEVTGRPLCTLNGPRWTVYDNHGGKNPKQVGAGTAYYVSITVFNSPTGFSCTRAKAAVKKMFPETMLHPHTAVVLHHGPAGFACRSVQVGPPETGSRGVCQRRLKAGTGGIIFQWSPLGVH
ncbi:MAG: hypothetical protein QOH73_759 [Gaiellaceae bacterium]|jgi:hypothetical protein|nr:hypothetical protein [Gaiellaceae bacterium]